MELTGRPWATGATAAPEITLTLGALSALVDTGWVSSTTVAFAAAVLVRTLTEAKVLGVETGLTDQVLDDPQHPYTQLLVSSVLQP